MIWQNLSTNVNYRLFLCDSLKNELAELNYIDLTFSPRFNDVNELNFEINYVLNEKGDIDPRFDMINSTSVILMQMRNPLNSDAIIYQEYFIVDTPTTEKEGQITKKVSCKSEQYWFFYGQYIPLYKQVAKLYDGSGSNGIINYLLSQTYNIYTVSYISSTLVDLYRSFDYTSTSQWDILKDLSEQFNCAFIFDNVNLTIQIRAMTDIGTDTGIILNNRNFILSISSRDKLEKSITRLFPYGNSHDINIRGWNITGEAYIDNFDDLILKGLMPSALATRYNSYKALIASKDGDWTTYNSQLDGYQASLLTKTNELSVLQGQLAVLVTQMDAIKKQASITRNNATYDNLYTQWQAKNIEITNKQSEINAINADITIVNNNITALQTSISWNTYFTLSERQQLIKFVRGKPEDFDSISDESQTEQLYEVAQQYLVLKSRIPIELTIDSVDLLSCYDLSYFYDKVIRIGDYLVIDCPELGYDNVSIRILEINHNPISNTLTFRCSNQDSLETDIYDLRKLWVANDNTTSTLSTERSSYTEYSNDKTSILFTDSTIDTSTNPIVAGDNVINQRGMIGSNLNTNGLLEYLSDSIIISKDNGANWRKFITGSGFYLENNAGTGRMVMSTDTAYNHTGFQVDKWNSSANQWDNVFYLDDDGNTIYDGGHIRMLSANNKNQILLNPSDGIKIQKTNGSGGWIDNLYVDSNGNIITKDSIIEGGLFRTGAIDTQRLEIDDNGVISRNASNVKHGMSWDNQGNNNGWDKIGWYLNDTQKCFIAYNRYGYFHIGTSDGEYIHITTTGILRLWSSNIDIGENSSSKVHLKGDISFEDGKIGFFNTTPVSKLSISDPSTITVSGTATDIYSDTEKDMINELKNDVQNLRSKVLELTNLLQYYGLG